MPAARALELEPARFEIDCAEGVTSVAIACRLRAKTKRTTDYVLVPFDVVPGTRRLEVAYAYEGQQEPGSRNEIDLGLVDPRGAEFPQFEGFRGWSGNARTSAVLTARAATPGYLGGPLPSARWWVLLGLYKLDPGGVEVAITVSMSPVEGELPAAPAPPTRTPLPRPKGQAETWLPGDLHSHTLHSDAPGTLDDLVGAARGNGLAFVAVTDHNTTSHFPYLHSNHGVSLIPGEEVTTYFGHMNVWGNATPMDFRVRDAADVAAIIAAAHAQGAVVSASHPTIAGMGWTFGYDLPLDCLEVWHGGAGPLNSAALAIWQRLLADGRRAVAVGGSDVHIGKPGSPPPGQPTTWLRTSSLDTPHVLDALRAGRVVITAPHGPWLELEVTAGTARWGVGDAAPARPMRVRALVERGEACRLRLLSAENELAAASVDSSLFALELDVDLHHHRFVRAELTLPDGPARPEFPFAALTNPIWSV